MITVGNVKRGDLQAPGAVYIGRACSGLPGSILKNKFIIGRDGDRSAVLSKYLNWLRSEYRQRAEVYSYLHELADRVERGEPLVLVCWCSPEPCHGDIVKMALEGILRKRMGG